MKVKLLFCVVCLLTVVCTRGLPPLVGDVRGPASVVMGQVVACTSDARGVWDDSVSIRFCWGDGDTSDWSAFVGNRKPVVATHVWRDPGRVVVKAQARNESGLRSEWLGGLRLGVMDTSIVKWISHVGPVGATCPAVGPDGTVYVATGDGLVAMDPTGHERWRSHQFGASHSPVVGEDGTVYILKGRLYALDPDGATLRVDSLADEGLDCPALGPDGTIYVSRRDTVVALNPDGSLRWKNPVPGSPDGSPAVATDSSICWVLGYVATDSPSVFVFNADGTRRWSARVASVRWVTAGELGSFTIVADERCYTLDRQGTITSERGFLPGVTGPAVVGSGEELYVPTRNGMQVVQPDSVVHVALLEWDIGMSALLDSAGDLYFGGDSSRDRHAVFRMNMEPWPSPLVGVDGNIDGAPGIGPDGTIYVGSGDGYLYAIRGTAPLAGTIWPKYAHDSRNTGCAAVH